MEALLEEIKQRIKEPDLIEKAFEFAKTAHTDQKRFSGEDYIEHPLRVALILSRMDLDSKSIAASFLHDVIDDTSVSLEDIEKKFGEEIAFLVDGVSKLGKIRYPKEPLEIKPLNHRASNPIDLQAENLRKMFFAMAKDIRVVLIKLADRLDNMRTLSYIPEEKQKRFALETLEIFAPLANRLGIGEIKGLLEDLAFPYLYPKEYEWLIKNIKEKYEDRKQYLEKIVPVLKSALRKEGIKILDIHSRPKHYFSLYQKLLKHEMDIGKIYDLVAVRIIVEDIKACYQTLGIIHKHFQPLPGRIKDYIAIPKPNGYQSIHTTVFAEGGVIIEIQIRTYSMHEEAEYGICAHWASKEGINLSFQQKRFTWISQLKDWQKEILSPKEFLEGLKVDFFKNRIFVFTPQGDVIDLPEGAGPVDFAYAVHTEIGNCCVGAKVDDKIVPLDYALKNGDVIEILLDKDKNPSRDWLKFAKTNLARSHIRKQTKSFFGNLKEKIMTKAAVKKLSRKKESFISSPKIIKTQTVEVGGKTGISIALAKCCNPKPGDKIKSYITKRKGASIHLENCKNLKKSAERSPEKIILASWKEK